MKTIDIASIRIDGDTQSRVQIDNNTVTEYAEAIKSGDEFPAVVVFYDGVDGWLADGFHRYHAHTQAGKTSIVSDVRKGTVRDAKLYSVGANGRHGKRPTNADKRKSVLAMLGDAEWAAWSDGAIAKTCAVSQNFVSSVRRSLKSDLSEKPTERTYTTKHGTTSTMKTGGIGKAQNRAAEQPANQPAAEPATKAQDTPKYTALDEAQDHIQELHQQNQALQDRLDAIVLHPTDDEAAQALAHTKELRQQVRTLEINLEAVTRSRDQYQNEAAQAKRQCLSLQNKLKRLRA